MAFTNGFAQQNNTISKDVYCGNLALNYATGNNFIELLYDMAAIYITCMDTTPLPEMTIDAVKPKQ